MKTFFLCTVAAFGLCGVAQAADMPVKAPVPVVVPAFTWAGCYVGANAGWGRTEHNLSTSVPTGSAINATARDEAIAAGAADLSNDGFTGGLQGGCNWQPYSQVVLGFEADFNWVDAGASRDATFIGPVSGFAYRSVDDVGMDWFSTVRARVGVAFDRVLIYGTGGVAIADGSYSKNLAWGWVDPCPAVNGLADCHVGGADKTRFGWTAGAGIEYAFTSNWSAKVEYLYADFGSSTYGTQSRAFPTQHLSHSVDTTLSVVRVGLNYRLWAPQAPVVARY